MQQQAQRRHRNNLFSLPASAKKVNQLLRFRLGCLAQLPVEQGRYTNTSREQRLCRHCPSHGDEKYHIFECTASHFLRPKYSHLFEHQSAYSHESGYTEGGAAFHMRLSGLRLFVS